MDNHNRKLFPPFRATASSPCASAIRLALVLVLVFSATGLRGDDTATQKPPAAKTGDVEKKLDTRAMIRKLQDPADIKADKKPLKDVLAELSKRHHVSIRLDEPALKQAGDAPITLTVKNLTLQSALDRLLKDQGLKFVSRDGGILVTANAAAAKPAQAAKAGPDVKKAEPAPKKAVVAKADGAARMVPVVEADVVQQAVLGRRARAAIDPEQLAAMIAEMEKQFNRQFAAALAIEINFVQKVCQPTDAEVAEINTALEQYRVELVKKYSESSKKARNGQVPAWSQDSHSGIRGQLARVVKTRLTADQAARYEEEVELRDADRKRATINSLVAQIDQAVNLSTTQREQLVESLKSSWKEEWGNQFNTSLRQPGNQFHVSLPPRLVEPHLSETQKKIWRAVKDSNQANQGALFFQGGFMGGIGIAVDAFEMEDLIENEAIEEADEIRKK